MLSKKLLNKARQSLCHTRVVAVGLDARGNVVAMATNRPRFSKIGGSVHAEIACLHKSPASLVRIIVARAKKTELKRIDPCPACRRICARNGVSVSTIC